VRAGWNDIELNGRRQWVSLRGAVHAPLLLFVHGGPGASEFPQRRRYLRDLERDWLVADWDQPGAGRSYRGDETSQTLSLETLVDDGAALVQRLAGDFGEQPVVLVGHSFGTVLGVRIAVRTSQHLAAYVGASQVVNWALQEERSFDWALQEARRTGNHKAEESLERIRRPIAGQYETGTDGVKTQRRWLGTLGGVAVDPRFVARWALSVFTRGGYPLAAKLHYLKAMDRSMDLIWPQLCEDVDLRRDVPALAQPVHLFAGRQDRITDLAQIQEWITALQAPTKRLVVVDRAGHLNLYEQPGRFVTFMDEVRSSLP
jgi:pimeloyl-ACP methyl ester carboxylesterase